MDIVNRYASLDLFIPTNAHQAIVDFVSRSDADGKPFARQVDAWWVAIAIGVCMGTRTPMPEARVKFNTGAILASDAWRITHLELLALAEEGESCLENPPAVLQVASEYAVTGINWMVDVLLGEAEPTLTLMNRLGELVEMGPVDSQQCGIPASSRPKPS